MSRITETFQYVDDYRTAEMITGVLQDIGSVKMQSIRLGFEQNARFFAGIRAVYAIVKAHAQELGLSETANAKTRDLYIALTSNKRFYGTLNRDIIRAFLQLIRTAQGSDFFVVGQTGAQYLQRAESTDAVTRVEFADDAPTADELKSLMAKSDPYRRVFLVYPKFINTFRQDIALADITETPSDFVPPSLKAKYIFEPEIQKMLQFFEGQVRRVLFERVLLETELARSAARSLKMRDARERAGDLRKKYQHELNREYATVAEIELMETFIGYRFWKR
jgi:ATP synthase F1 gamma subunit